MEITKAFADAVRAEPFGGKLTVGQVSGMNFLIDTWYQSHDANADIRWLVYAFATAFWETSRTMRPVIETFNPLHDIVNPSVEVAITRLDASYWAGNLSWVKQPYWRKDAAGQSWLGRGYVQLTFKSNYLKAYQETGVDCVTDPSLALDPVEAGLIMFSGMTTGWFTGKKLADYFSVHVNDPLGARRIINGTDHAADIAKIYTQFLNAFNADKGTTNAVL